MASIPYGVLPNAPNDPRPMAELGPSASPVFATWDAAERYGVMFVTGLPSFVTVNHSVVTCPASGKSAFMEMS